MSVTDRWQTDRPFPAILQADLREHFDRLDDDQAGALAG
jgi:hypothetical protein